ncbi:VWA domain-containing protein, partial [Salmonella sp. s54925]|uniref:VWA domain-containing protein n=1 Tax=Salmonella sp. s54925 TaxID=3159674 RepID=UPI00397F979A
LLTDGAATSRDKADPKTEAAALKKDGVTIIAIAMGSHEKIEKFSDVLKKIASTNESGKTLEYEVGFKELDSIANELVTESCKVQSNTVPV